MTSTTPVKPVRVPVRALARTGIAVVFWIAVWQVTASVVDADFLLASPFDVALRLTELVPTADFWGIVAFSLGRIGIGFAGAAVGGTVLGAAAARSSTVSTLAAPLIATIRSAPVVSFIILLLLWVHGPWLAAYTSFLMVLPVMYGNVLEGVRRRDAHLLQMASVFRVPWHRRLTAITVPAVAPFLAAACRSGVGLAWKSGVAAEVIGVAGGSIGERLYQAKVFLESADLFAWTAVIVTLSVICEWLVLWCLGRIPGAAAVAAGGAS